MKLLMIIQDTLDVIELDGDYRSNEPGLDLALKKYLENNEDNLSHGYTYILINKEYKPRLMRNLINI